MNGPAIGRRVAQVLAWVLLLYAVVATRAWWEAREELERGQAARTAQDPAAAIRHFGRAVRWYTPASAANRDAVRQLWDLGQTAEQQGNPAQALTAYRELRGGLYAVRTLWQPHGEWIPRADDRIAALMAAQSTIDRQGRPATLEARTAEHLALLRQPPEPSAALSLLVVLAFFGWLGAAFAAIQLGLDPTGRPRWRRLAWCGGLGGVSFVVWLLALRWA